MLSIVLARFFDAFREVSIILSSQPHPHISTPQHAHILTSPSLVTIIPPETSDTMMLANPFFQPQQQYYSPYTPPKSSPLSERSANAAPRLFDFGMASQSNANKSPTPKRAYKPNPVMQTRDAATKRRRDMFFKRVQNGREDKKWEARGEQVCTARSLRDSTRY
jgi:hypothetical protein